jgi:aldehyde dehydrogenase (NAD+)
MPSQVDVIRRHLDDAVERGGRAVVGGRSEGPWVEPTVLVDVPEDSAAVREETFGPTLTVTRVPDAEEALRRTNDSPYGLAGAVFTRSARRGLDLARRMRSGMTSINAVTAFASVPALPFGGIGDSGFGRIHGGDGLKEFTRAKAITRQRFPLPFPMQSFDRPGYVIPAVRRAMKLRHGRPLRRMPRRREPVGEGQPSLR